MQIHQRPHSRTSSSFVDWSSLPPELLQTIAANLQTIIDYIRFRAVCRSWRTAAEISRPFLPREFPWLMLPSPLSESESSDCRRSFFNPLTNTLHRLSLPEASVNHRRVGSSSGRVVLMDGSPDIIVVNPLTREKTSLPPLLSFPNVMTFDSSRVGGEYYIQRGEDLYSYNSPRFMRNQFLRKVILIHNSDDHPNKFVAFALSNLRLNLAYCKHDDLSWRSIDGARRYNEDAIYFRGKLYLVSKRGSLAICDVDNPDSTVLEFINVERQLEVELHDQVTEFQYLVKDSMGELLLVSRYVSLMTTRNFGVFKFDWSARKWNRMMSLGDQVLFLGQNSSLALLASDYPGCKANVIYFTDDHSQRKTNYIGMCDDGMYNLDTKRVEDLPIYDGKSLKPIWITPTLC